MIFKKNLQNKIDLHPMPLIVLNKNAVLFYLIMFKILYTF